MNRFEIYPVRVENKRQAEKVLTEIDCWQEGTDIMAPKALHFTFKLGPLRHEAAIILKQEMLSKGGEAALHWEVLKGRDHTFALLMGTLAQYRRLLPRLYQQPFGLRQLGKELKASLEKLSGGERSRFLKCGGGRTMTLGEQTLVMGILNVTPDSFSDGGQLNSPGEALEAALEMESLGADIIDIGAESTRPAAKAAISTEEPLSRSPFSARQGEARVTAQEEMDRLLPVLEKLSLC